MSHRGKSLSRRNLLVAGVPGALALAGVAGGAGAMLLRPAPRDPGRLIRACRLSHMDVGGQVLLPGVLVVRDQSGLYAMSTVCTHLGCGIVRDQAGFVCHCHGSTFDEMGVPLQGPATEPLPWFAVQVDDSDRRGAWVLVDLDREVDAGSRTRV